MTLEETLKKFWGYDYFRPMQREIIDSVLDGHDTLALMPTGGGKSLCYQLPALMREGTALVVTPLISLMKDQVDALRQRHIRACCLNSNMNRHEIEVTLNRCLHSDVKLLYVSPERLRSKVFTEHLRQMRVSFIAVDEAHCISQWGYDFRPPYREIARIRAYAPKAPVIALTATATPEVAKDICEQLQFRNSKTFRTTHMRGNLSYRVTKDDDKYGTLLRTVSRTGGCGIVYVRNRRRTKEIAQMLSNNGIPAAAYHAGMSLKERELTQNEWIKSSNGVIVGTTAFGMGIDKADVRYVVHMDIPESIEAYFQEAGRAGRDGNTAYAILIYDKNDIETLRHNVRQNYPSVRQIRNVYKAICNYYQIPIGSGTGSQYDFDYSAICNAYNIEVNQFFYSIQFLVREGVVALPENNELQSKVYIPTSKETLYSFQLQNPVAGDVIATMLRMYGGMFTDYTPITEQAIARRSELTEAKICNILFELDKQGIIHYKRRTLKPQIVFTTPRIDENNLQLTDSNYQLLKDNAIRRSEAMISYVENCGECRSRQLLNYFGEAQSENCGICDVCDSHNNKAGNKDIGEQIEAIVKQQPMTIRDLAKKMPHVDSDTLAGTVRNLVEKKRLQISQDFRISCLISR